jgi:hypothetical protein
MRLLLPDGNLVSDVGGGESHHDAAVDESGSVASSSKRNRGKKYQKDLSIFLLEYLKNISSVVIIFQLLRLLHS